MWFLLILAVKLKMINQDRMNRYPLNFTKDIFYSIPNSPENFPNISRILVHGKWSNFWYIKYNFATFYRS